MIRKLLPPRSMQPALLSHSGAAAVGLALSLVFTTSVFAQGATPSNAAKPPATAAGAAGITAAPAGAAPAAGAAYTLPAPRQSWTSDRRSFVVGDIITVLIDDYTITTAVKENSASDTRSRDLGLQASLPSSSKNIGIDTRNDAVQNVKGSAKRENRFQNEMSVRVVAVGANGLLQLKGTKNINVDKNVQDIQLTGWVRSQDVSMQNTVESARLADASIGYASPGTMAKPKQGMVSKILGAFWP